MDWNIIIKIKEFSEHVCNKDLIQLSMCSKKARNNLFKNLFNTFNLHPFAYSSDYSSLFKDEIKDFDIKVVKYLNPYKSLTKELTESKKAFNKELKQFSRSPKSLIVSNYKSYNYLLDEVLSIFYHITTLVLDNSTFTTNTLQSLFGNFKFLENLVLIDNLILHNAKISNNYTITYPTSLRSLKLKYNFVMKVEVENDSISTRSHIAAVTYQHLPNLVTFDHFLGSNLPEQDIDLFNFIKLNSQLECLIVSGYPFNFELFDIINDNQNLTHFEFMCLHYPRDLIDFNVPELPNIKHLYLAYVDYDCNSFIMYKFHNVTELEFEFDGEFTRKNKWLIESFGKLKSLKLISKYEFNYSKKVSLKDMYHLEKLEFYFEYEKGKFDPFNINLKASKKVNLITFTKNPSYTPFENSKENINLIKNWDYLYFPYKLTYIKKSK